MRRLGATLLVFLFEAPSLLFPVSWKSCLSHLSAIALAALRRRRGRRLNCNSLLGKPKPQPAELN
jgi:hypothetical protein